MVKDANHQHYYSNVGIFQSFNLVILEDILHLIKQSLRC
jgi:hypothetical protein